MEIRPYKQTLVFKAAYIYHTNGREFEKEIRRRIVETREEDRLFVCSTKQKINNGKGQCSRFDFKSKTPQEEIIDVWRFHE